MRDFVYLAPESLEEAAALKLEHDDKAIFMAGATDVIIRLRDHLIAPDYVIDLKNIPDIGGITFSETDGLHIGALATMTQIANNEHVKAHYPYLAEAASYVGGRQIRNRATCVGNIVNAPLPPNADGTRFRAAWSSLLLPAVAAFRPQLLLVSAGFDGHRRDPLAELQLEADDFAWISRELVQLANRHCGGRIVSMLEGGYDLEGLAESSVAHVRELLA